MKKHEAKEELRRSIRRAMTRWIEEQADTKAWAALDSYFGEGLASLMGDAAFAVFKGMIDLNEYLKHEHLIGE